MNRQTLFYVVLFILTTLLFKQLFFDQTPTEDQQSTMVETDDESFKPYQQSNHSQVALPINNDADEQNAIQGLNQPQRSEIVSCNIEDTETSSDTSASPYKQEFEQLISSQSMADKLVLAVFSSILTQRNRLTFLSHYTRNYPQDKLAYYHLLNACHQIPKSQHCQYDFSEPANNADSDNGMLWVIMAGLYLKQGDEALALEALRTAATKRYYSDYTFESTRRLSDSIAPYSTKSVNDTLLTAFDYTATFKPEFGQVFEYCQQNDLNNVELIDACFQLGNNMANNSRTIMLASLGSSLSQEMYLLEENESHAQAIEEESNKLFEQRFRSDAQKATSLMRVDESLTQLWLEQGLALGESEAIEQVIQEAKWKSQDPNYNPCSAPN